ncbi:MAG: hypothetical protein NVS4B11_07090 [Ktedonobacteraceae bacterium]
MQDQRPAQHRSSGAKAITIDERATIARYRVLQIVALILSAGFALGLRLVFGR